MRVKKRMKAFMVYSNLPTELRMMIVNSMTTEDRCRFSGCSRLCNKEVKDSKNYMYALKLRISDYFINLEVHYDDADKGCVLSFEDNLGKKYLTCKRLQGSRRLWTYDFDEWTNLIQYAYINFKNVLNGYQHMLKNLSIDIIAKELKYVDFEIENLYNLEKLTLHANADIRLFLSKTRNSLRELYFSAPTYNSILNDCKEVYQIQTTLHASRAQFSAEEFFRLSAQLVAINIGQLTEEDIFRFVKSWQNDTIRHKVKRYHWYLTNSEFNVEKLFKMFGEEHDRFTEKIDIIHKKEAGKLASLLISLGILEFETNLY